MSDEARQPPVHSQPGRLDSVKAGLTLVFVRDWHPVLRAPLDVVRLSFLVGAVVYATLGDWDATVRLLAPGFFVFLVRAVDVPRPVDWTFCLAMVFQGWGKRSTSSASSGGTTTWSTSRSR